MHARVLEALVRLIGHANESLDDAHRGPLNHLIEALVRLQTGSPDSLITPVKRAPGPDHEVGRPPSPSAAMQALIWHAVLASRLLKEKAGWTQKEADEFVATTLNHLLPPGARAETLFESTIRGWRGYRSPLFDDAKAQIDQYLDSIDPMDREKGRKCALQLCANAIERLPLPAQ